MGAPTAGQHTTYPGEISRHTLQGAPEAVGCSERNPSTPPESADQREVSDRGTSQREDVLLRRSPSAGRDPRGYRGDGPGNRGCDAASRPVRSPEEDRDQAFGLPEPPVPSTASQGPREVEDNGEQRHRDTQEARDRQPGEPLTRSTSRFTGYVQRQLSVARDSSGIRLIVLFDVAKALEPRNPR